MKTKDASIQKFKGEASIGPITGNLTIETPILKEKSGLLIAARTTYSDWILKSLNNKKLNKSSASFIDLLAKYNHKINKKNSIKITSYYSNDKYQIASDTTNSYGNNIISLNWHHKFNDKNDANLILAASSYKFNLDYNSKDISKNFNLNYSIREVNAKLKFKYALSKKHNIKYGVSSKLYNISPGVLQFKDDNSLIENRQIDKEKGLENALFLSNKFIVNKKLSLDIGLRYSQFLTLGKATQNFYTANSIIDESSLMVTKKYKENEVIQNYNGLEYRLSARYLLGDNLSLKASYNKTFQYIHRLNNNTTATPIDTWRLSNINISPQEGNQISFGLFKNLNDYEFSFETYFKKYKNILNYKIGANFLLNENIETEVLQGPGKSYGIEFLIKKKLGKLNGWIGYNYSRSLLKLDSSFNEEKINNGNFFPTNYDKPHDFTTVLNYKITKRYSISTNFIYQTGNPVTYPTGKYKYLDSEYLLYSDRNKFRIPNYYRLDLGINIEGNHKIKKLAHSFWNISIYNVLGRNNPKSIFFNTNNQGKVLAYKSSIFSYPIPTITYNFKF
ncbi:TonB-dependent receptor [Tenacibaculum pacificus]|uniref:TonB-dependent receptor plug domain-containing protein n=1 Tax=Tenacibaculum pacificus TaxID=3018314 RepID=UPI0022F3ABEF|nr:TonB-dependent receptor [Tenacibaculum pacificus]WBX72821.1 TonB-dependent receptor [Tenacibaculum pacificus]